MNDRLSKLKADNDQVGEKMRMEAGRFARLSSRHKNGTAPRIVTAFNLFQTPELIADKMARLIPEDAKRILEPSAGLGRLYLAGLDVVPGARWVLVEQSPACCRELYDMVQDADLRQGDFLSREGLGLFDCVIMNPPFKFGRDIRHIKHALSMLRSRGTLIALCYNGAKQNKVLKPMADTWEILPEGSFKETGTRASVAMLTIKKA